MLTATTKAPAIALPMVTGIKFFSITSKKDTGAPSGLDTMLARGDTSTLVLDEHPLKLRKSFLLPTHPKTFPRVSGHRPARRPAGRMNMLVTECSKPMATNMEIGNQAPIIFPPRPLAMVHSHTAVQISQLHITPLTNVGPKSEEHFLGSPACEDSLTFLLFSPYIT